LPPMPSSRARRSFHSGLVSLLAAMQQSPVNRGVKERTVVVEYPSLEKATAAYDSPAYAEALKALGDGAVRDLRIVEGVE
jgi:uncharacterized protein (DUF1330 family)